MEIKLHHSSRGIWICIDGKHRKTVPKKYEDCILSNIKKLNFDKKHLQPNEKEIFHQWLFECDFASFFIKLKEKEKRIYELVANAKPVGVRKVVNPHKNREELVFDNNLKIKIPYAIYAKHPVKLPTVHFKLLVMKNYTGNKAIDGVYHKIINEIPEFSRFFELFAGSAAIAKLACKSGDEVFLNDIDKKVTLSLLDYINEKKLIRWGSINRTVFFCLHLFNFQREDFVFLDPPYLHSTRTNKNLYTHEFSDIDHEQLLSTVLAIDCKIMIIHPKCDLYDNTLKDWRKIEIKIRYNRKTSIECLYMNYPPLQNCTIRNIPEKTAGIGNASNAKPTAGLTACKTFLN